MPDSPIPDRSMPDPLNVPFSVAFVLLTDFSNLGVAAAVEPLFVANWLTKRSLFHWQLLSLDGLPVRASNGMRTAVDGALPSGLAFDVIIVAASFSATEHAQNARLLNWLRRAARFGVAVGALETGSEILAAAGLLDGHEAAVHWYNLDGFRERYPSVAASGERMKIERGRLTCAGGTSSLDLMLHLIAAHAGRTLADEVAKQLLVQGPGKPAATPAVLAAEHCALAAEALMRETLEDPLPCRQLAARIGLSDRQLQRHFHRTFGSGIARHYLRLRLERAHKYVQQTELSLTEIALACGFGSIEHFSRSYRQSFGVAPRSDRSQSKAASVFRLHPQPGSDPDPANRTLNTGEMK